MDVTIIGAPMDLGAGRRGVDMGPSAIRHAGLQAMLARLGHSVQDAGDVLAPVVESLAPTDPAVRFAAEIAASCRALAERVADRASAGQFPVVLGGDHSIALGTLAGICRVAQRIGVVYVDAHGDFNTPETSPTGNVHGMPLAAALGVGDQRLLAIGPRRPMLRREDVALLAVREVDPDEATLLRAHGPATIVTLREIDETGMKRAVDQCIERATRDADWLHVSFDMDAIDPRFAPGTGAPVEGGLTTREAHLIMEHLADSGRVRSLELVETNPILDHGNQTGQLAARLIASCLGKRIL